MYIHDLLISTFYSPGPCPLSRLRTDSRGGEMEHGGAGVQRVQEVDSQKFEEKKYYE